MQELIAPEKRISFSADWTAIGRVLVSWIRLSDAYGHVPEISTLLGEITGIDVKILRGAKLSDIKYCAENVLGS